MLRIGFTREGIDGDVLGVNIVVAFKRLLTSTLVIVVKDNVDGKLVIDGRESVGGRLVIDGSEIDEGRVVIDGRESVEGRDVIDGSEIVDGRETVAERPVSVIDGKEVAVRPLIVGIPAVKLVLGNDSLGSEETEFVSMIGLPSGPSLTARLANMTTVLVPLRADPTGGFPKPCVNVQTPLE